MKVRKKPVVVEAVQFITIASGMGVRLRFSDVPAPNWLNEALKKPEGEQGAVWLHDNGRQLLVGTLESPHEANPGDWIIRGVKGELYPVRDDIFKVTYEAVDAA